MLTFLWERDEDEDEDEFAPYAESLKSIMLYVVLAGVT